MSIFSDKYSSRSQDCWSVFWWQWMTPRPRTSAIISMLAMWSVRPSVTSLQPPVTSLQPQSLFRSLPSASITWSIFLTTSTASSIRNNERVLTKFFVEIKDKMHLLIFIFVCTLVQFSDRKAVQTWSCLTWLFTPVHFLYISNSYFSSTHIFWGWCYDRNLG